MQHKHTIKTFNFLSRLYCIVCSPVRCFCIMWLFSCKGPSFPLLMGKTQGIKGKSKEYYIKPVFFPWLTQRGTDRNFNDEEIPHCSLSINFHILSPVKSAHYRWKMWQFRAAQLLYKMPCQCKWVLLRLVIHKLELWKDGIMNILYLYWNGRIKK